MEVRKEVMQRVTISVEEGEKLRHHADRMIDNGLEYNSMATGAAEVYLQVLEGDPEIAYYHLTEPRLDVGEADELGFRYPFTAVGQLVGFSLMSLHSPVRDQAWRDGASKLLGQWHEDLEDVLHSESGHLEVERLLAAKADVNAPAAEVIDEQRHEQHFKQQQRVIIQ
jgi:hypothetical protein